MTGKSEDLLALLTVSGRNQGSPSRIAGTGDPPVAPDDHRTATPRRKRVRGVVGLVFLVVTTSVVVAASGWLGRRKVLRVSSTAATKAKSEPAPPYGSANKSRLKRDDDSAAEVGKPREPFDYVGKPFDDNSSDRDALDHGVERRIPKRSPHHAYQCGYHATTALLNSIFPETNATKLPPELRKQSTLNQMVQSFQSDDVLLLSCGGPCFMPMGRLLSIFPGTILTANGESTWARCPYSIPPNLTGRVTSITRVGSNRARWNESTYSMALLASANPRRIQLYRPDMRPRGTGMHFLIYANSNCVRYRDEAFRRLAAIGPEEVHYAGKCRGGRGGVGIRANETAQRKGYATNANLYHDYRFTLAMENAPVPGYISEKIMMPFLAGSVPIYYGTTEVFDVFNRNAFVWYDVNDPQPALDQVKYLEANRTAYAAMLRQPILANGEETIAKYFSLRDEDGGGRLKWAIRDRIGFG
jgi:Glycosyltransferase family 10 (fucosyltransferase) C-term